MCVEFLCVCESDQETNNELLSDSTGNNVNVFHVANLTHNQSETMNSEFKHFKNAGLDLENSRSVYIESVHPPDMCSKPGGIKGWFSPAFSDCRALSQQTFSPQLAAQLRVCRGPMYLLVLHQFLPEA